MMRKAVAIVLISAVAVLGAPIGVRAAAADQNPPHTGSVQGVAKNAQQQPMPSARVQLRTSNGPLAATGTTNAAGEFSFAGLNPGTYVIEVLNEAGAIVGTATVGITAGAVATVSLSASALGAIGLAASGGAGLFGLGTIGTVAVLGAAGAATIGTIVATKTDASPSR